jgi:hypothetical protein
MYAEGAEYRGPAEVFHPDSLASLASVPVTINHPAGSVTPENAAALQLGLVTDGAPESGVRVDGDPHEWVRTTLIATHADLIQALERGDVEGVSCGYTCDLDPTPGTAPDGTPYKFRQKNIRFNHVAVLTKDHKPRAGESAKVRLDNKESMKVVLIDGVEFELGSEKHLAKLAQDNQAALAAANARADKAEAARDTEKARADKAEGLLSTDSLDKLVEARLNLLKAAAPFLAATYETSGKSNLQICKDALSAAGVDCAGKSDAYVEARFDGLTAKDQPAQFHNPGQKPAPRADAAVDHNDDDAFRAALAKKLESK